MFALCLVALQAVIVVVANALPYEDTHLVTMRKAEMLEIVKCVAKAKNPILCEKFDECEKMMPPKVLLISNACKKECGAASFKKCSPYKPLYETFEIPEKIFDCIAKKEHKYTVEDKQKMVMFEKCVRDLHALSRFAKSL